MLWGRGGRIRSEKGGRGCVSGIMVEKDGGLRYRDDGREMVRWGQEGINAEAK